MVPFNLLYLARNLCTDLSPIRSHQFAMYGLLKLEAPVDVSVIALPDARLGKACRAAGEEILGCRLTSRSTNIKTFVWLICLRN